MNNKDYSKEIATEFEEKLEEEIVIEAKNRKSNAVVEIRNGHTNITKIIKDGKEIFKSDDNSSSKSSLKSLKSKPCKPIRSF